MAFWVVDLRRPWWPLIATSDASPAYGFGLSVASASPCLARAVASHTGVPNHFFRLGHAAKRHRLRERVGEMKRLPLAPSHFRTILSVRCRRVCHSGALEAQAVVLSLRRLLRDVRLHRARAPFLVDARAVMDALRKGRSSAPTLRYPVRQCAALLLAADVRMHFGYIPSESNPADPPSRGIRGSLPRRRKVNSNKFDKLTAAMYHRARAARRLSASCLHSSVEGHLSSSCRSL